MAVEASLRGKGCRFSVRLDGYSEGRAAYDANQLTGEVEVEVGESAEFHAKCRIEISVAELVRFTDALRALDQSLNGEAALSNPSGFSDFHVRVALAAGKGNLDGMVREPGSDLRFSEKRTDQTFMAEALREFDALVRAFPERETEVRRGRE